MTALNPLWNVKSINTSRIVCLHAQHYASRYERFQNFWELTGTTASLNFHCYNVASGGTREAFAQDTYTLYGDGIACATATVNKQNVNGTFNVDLTLLPDKKWVMFTIGPMVAPESNTEFFMFVNRTGATITPAEQESCPVISGSYEWSHGPTSGTHGWGLIPAVLDPMPAPLIPRDTPDFNTADSYAGMYREHLVPISRTNSYVRRPVRSPSGVVSTMNRMPYFFQDLIRNIPTMPLLDGPRGVGSLFMPTHMQTTRDGGLLALDPWRLVKIMPNGEIITRCGYRHRLNATNNTPMGWGRDFTPFPDQDLELIGDWSAIPAERRGMHETWGFAWDEGSLAVDSGAAQLGPPANRSGFEHPHTSGPVGFIADSQNNRILRLQFSAVNHDPPVVTEFLTGLADPWDVVYNDGKIYVSERKANRIVAYDADTGALVSVVMQGPAYGTGAIIGDNNRFLVRVAPGANITEKAAYLRANYNCVLPEGLFLQDGYLYFGSGSMGCVRKINLADNSWTEVATAPVGDNTFYFKISLSDGTFGPRGTVFISSWSNGNFGYPESFLPNGTKWNFFSYDGGTAIGPGGLYRGLGYSAAQAVGHGKLFCGSSDEGVVMFSKTLPSDPPMDKTRMLNGQTLWHQNFDATHGQNGFSFNLPLPWGAHPDIDYFLEWNGHRKNSISFKANIRVKP